MPEDDTIGRIIRRDLDRLPMLPADRWVPRPRPARGWLPAVGARLGRGALAVGAAAFLVVSALAVGSTVRALRASPVASDPQTARAQPLGICAGAQDRALGLSGIVTRLDRIAVKRMTVSDLESGRDAQGAPLSKPAAPLASNTFLCVVAVSGEIRQSFGLLDTGPFKWAVFVSVAGGDDPVVSTSMGSAGSWPSYFDALPDRQGNPYPGTVVEVVGSDDLKVRLDSAALSAEFGNPVLVAASKYTLIEPGSATVAATGVRPGDRVAIFFERENRNPSSGAYPLSIFRLTDSSTSRAIPKCPAGQTPVLDVTNPPPPGPLPGSGSANAGAAFRKAKPAATSFDMYPFGSDQKAQSPADFGRGPVWIVAGDETFIAMVLGQADGNNWFAYPAKFLGCRSVPAASPGQPSNPQAPPGVVLDLRTGTGADQPGVTHTAANPALGPTSVAVDEGGRVYLWDQANGRVLVYDGGRLVRKVAVPVPPLARELVVLNGKLYFALNASGARQEWELDATTGATLRTIPPAPTGRQSTLYPTTRWTPATLTVNGVWPIGIDRYGNRYERFIDATCSRGAAVCGEVRRRTAAGSLLDTATEPAGIAVQDYYVGWNGDMYELREDRGASDGGGVVVVRLLAAPPVADAQVGLSGQVRDYERMRQDGVQRPGDPPLIPNDGIPPGSALVADAVVRLEPYGIEARTDAQGMFVLPPVDVPAPCRWVTVTVTKVGFGNYRMEFALYSPDAHLGLQLWIEHHDVDQHSGPPQAAANTGEAYCWR